MPLKAGLKNDKQFYKTVIGLQREFLTSRGTRWSLIVYHDETPCHETNIFLMKIVITRVRQCTGKKNFSPAAGFRQHPPPTIPVSVPGRGSTIIAKNQNFDERGLFIYYFRETSDVLI